MASTEPGESCDAEYQPGQLTQLLNFNYSPTDQCDSALASLFQPAAPADPKAATKSSSASLKKKKKPSSADSERQTAKRRKISSDAKEDPKGSEEKKAEQEQVGDRAAAKARTKLAKQREKARQEDPRNDRTVFVGNVSSTAKKRHLLLLFRAHGPIESVRFRSAAPADANVVKRLAVIHKKLSRPSLNAYVVYKEPESVAKAVAALNGHCLDGLHLGVDRLVGETQRDDKKCVFLGNLHFKCDEESVRSAFAQCGHLTNIRLVRDSRTGIGRGFGYVQFADPSAVELALKLNGVAEVAGRLVRVSRCTSEAAKTPQKRPEKRQQETSSVAQPAMKKKKKKQTDDKVQKNNSRSSNAGNKKAKKRPAARPTNRTFAEAFQQMLDKRRSKQSAASGNKKKKTNKIK